MFAVKNYCDVSCFTQGLGGGWNISSSVGNGCVQEKLTSNSKWLSKEA